MIARLSLVVISVALCAAKPCDVREKELYVEALTARGGVALLKAESALIEHRRPADCVEAAQRKAGAAPERVSVEVDLPRQPEGTGAGPWVFVGLGVGLAAGAVVVDVVANGVRDRLEEAQASGDIEGFDAARDDFITHQWIARGLAAGAAVAGVTGILWLTLGGEDDAVQVRPVFGPTTAGVGGRF